KGFRIFSNPNLHFTNYLSTLYFCLHSRSASWRITGTLLFLLLSKYALHFLNSGFAATEPTKGS
ncbi:MAG: hypothetical protein ABIQ31_25615, partial [Ferruginibacter sp.]